MRLHTLLRIAVLFSAVMLVGPLSQVCAQHHLNGLTQPVQPAPNGAWFDSGCGGQNGNPVTVSISPVMRPGFSSSIRIDNLPANAPALLLFGASPHNWLGVSLPLPLDALGLTSCNLSVSPDIKLLFAAGSSATVPITASFTVPNTLAIAAHPVFFQVLFNQPGLNPAGLGMGRGYATRVAPFVTPTAMRSSVTQHGITFQFAQPVLTGQFVNGDWFVVGPATVVGMTPPCTTVNGRVLNGAMVNPDSSTQNQGYDSTLFDPQHYSNSRNAAWNLSAGNPLQLPTNSSLVKAISNTNTALVPILQTCAVLTVLAAVPPSGSFRPPYSGTDHVVRYDAQMIDWSKLLSLAPAVGVPSVASVIAGFERPWLDHAPGWATRYMHPADNMPDYGRDLASDYNEAALLCNTALPMADKQALATHLVQIGIDFFANVQGGAYWEGVGGHGSGRKFPILFAGSLLGARDLLDVGVDYVSVRNLDGTNASFFGEDCQTFYVQQTSGTEINWGYGGYDASHLGMPEYGFSHVHYPDNDDIAWGSNSYRRCCTANAWIGGLLCVRMMGLVDEWNHQVLFDYMDRYAQLEAPGWTRSWSPWCGEMWDLYRAQF